MDIIIGQVPLDEKKSVLDQLLENMTFQRDSIGKETSHEASVEKRWKSKSAISILASEPSMDSEGRTMTLKMQSSVSNVRLENMDALKKEILQRLAVRDYFVHKKTVLKKKESNLSVEG